MQSKAVDRIRLVCLVSSTLMLVTLGRQSLSRDAGMLSKSPMGDPRLTSLKVVMIVQSSI